MNTGIAYFSKPSGTYLPSNMTSHPWRKPY